VNNILANDQNQLEITKHSLITPKIISVVTISPTTSRVMYRGAQVLLVSYHHQTLNPCRSLRTHALAEKLPKDGIFSLNSPFELG